jgi:uncharacterized membrane protein
MLFLLLCFSGVSSASVQVCNRADSTILVAVGLEHSKGSIGTKGWWKIYPGFCGEPVNLKDFKGRFFVHSRSHPILVANKDKFLWGELEGMCVQDGDFDINDTKSCPDNSFLAAFNVVQANWKSANTINIINPAKEYADGTSNRIAGIQRMLLILGYPLQHVNGVMDLDTRSALSSLSRDQEIDQTNHANLFIQLDEIIQNRVFNK